jgi:hypothetical protein
MTHNWKSRLQELGRFGKYLAGAAVVVLISFLYPDNTKFKYEFQKGQTWRYETLPAPFDFPIKKSAREISDDRAALEKSFSPYYRFNPDLPDAKRKDFEAAVYQQFTTGEPDSVAAQIRSEEKLYFTYGARLLHQLYSQGIIELSPEHADPPADFVINVVRGNVTFKRTLPGFLTKDQALQILRDSLDSHPVGGKETLLALLEKSLAPNLTYDAALTQKLKDEAMRSLVTTKGVVRKGEEIVSKGGVVTEEVYEKLDSYQAKFESDVLSRQDGYTVYAGYLLLTALMLGVFLLYLHTYRREILMKWNYLGFVYLWLLAFSYFTYLVERVGVLSVLVIPFCIAPIVVRHFFTYRLAFFTHVVVVLIASFLTTAGFQFIFMQILAGVVAVLAVADARNWSKFFQSVLSILLTYSLALLGLSLIEEGDLLDIDWSAFSWLLLNALLTLLAFPLIPLMERIFGFTSSISLVELADMNRPLLKELAVHAPGTLQHSIQVGNLSEAAANEIGADALLVRVGALYHDVGKMLNPEYFVENQTNISPHETLDNLQSAAIIIEHVTEGVRLARKNRLPQALVDFILTHHGTTRVEYFYRTYRKENPGKEVDEALFSYPGPKPSTKEQAILMLADSIEATSRSLQNPTGQDIDDLVEKITAGKIKEGQFSDTSLTFGELERCKAVFKKMLRSIYHVRIEYPEASV